MSESRLERLNRETGAGGLVPSKPKSFIAYNFNLNSVVTAWQDEQSVAGYIAANTALGTDANGDYLEALPFTIVGSFLYIDEPGVYSVNISVEWNASSTGQRYLYATMGTGGYGCHSRINPAASGNTAQSGSFIAFCPADSTRLDISLRSASGVSPYMANISIIKLMEVL